MVNDLYSTISGQTIQTFQRTSIPSAYHWASSLANGPSMGKGWPGAGPFFFSIGAVLFGLGVILLIAFNWQRMHKLIKLAVIFSALISTKGVGFWLRRLQSPYQTAGEGLRLLGTMLFGAGI